MNEPLDKPYNEQQLKEFDELITMMDSFDQVKRIEGRIDFWAWQKSNNFTTKVLDQMFAELQARDQAREQADREKKPRKQKSK